MRLSLSNFNTLIFTIILTFGGNAMAFEMDRNAAVCSIDGIKYPAVGFGTYPLQGETCRQAILDAAELGYRIIDTATFYQNFTPIGEAMRKLGREKFYLISKVWPTDQTPARLREDIKRTLEALQTSYVDAYLLHWPNNKIPIEDTLSEIERFRSQGLIRHIGLSNVTVNHLKRALELNIPIYWVQVEMNPSFYDAELLEFCHQNGIVVQAWGPLGRGRLSQDPLLKAFGQKYGKTAAQIAIKWILQHDCIPLPGSKNKEHMRDNFDVADFSLTEEEMRRIDERAKSGKRERVTKEMGVGFSDEFDFPYSKCWPKS